MPKITAIEEGAKAPAFTLDSNTGERVSLSAFKGKSAVVYFYPKDDTPGCTLEAEQFRDLMGDFHKLNAAVLGISPDSAKSHCKFIEKHKLNFALLSDFDHAVCEKYGAWGEKMLYGRRFFGVLRSTFLIDTKGRVAKLWRNVRPNGHAEKVLCAAREIAP